MLSIFCKNLVVIRTTVRPSRACHNITSVHRIRADLKDKKIEDQLRSDLYNQEVISNISRTYPSSLCHGVDVDSLGLFDVALKVEGPEHRSALVVDEEATSLEAVRVPGRHKSVSVQKNSSDASVARVVWWMRGGMTDVSISILPHLALSPKASLPSPHQAPKVLPAYLHHHSEEILNKKI